METAMSEHIRYASGESSLGRFIAAMSDKGLVALGFGDNVSAIVDTLHERIPGADLIADDVGLADATGRIAAIIDHPEREADIALDIRGSIFEKRVWDALRRIPAGETASYGEIAAGLGTPREAREVAEACAANPIAILIPCHRVVKKDGSLSGYRWGFKRKRELLAREHRAMVFKAA
jgi:AraC family transcriptional regulator of adaptative response/methylated-DNA-[protein]-cysteine methyltransferase